ncbi:unnamed protein product, partial [marine sediment metagenome]
IAEIEKKAYEHIYFFPHLDDVVFSCGGRIARQRHNRERVLVVTVFSGGLGQSGINDPLFAPFVDMDGRRNEDERAMEALKADYL